MEGKAMGFEIEKPRPAGSNGGSGAGKTFGIESKQHHTSSFDITRAFASAMLDAGIAPPDEIVGDGRLHRFYIEGQRRGSQNGAYVLHSDGRPSGWFQDFVSGVSGKWSASGGGGRRRITQADRLKIEAERAARAKSVEQRHVEVQAKAMRLWASATPCDSHPYLIKKCVRSHGLRTATWTKWLNESTGWRKLTIPNTLLVPLIDGAGAIWNLQAIFPETHAELGRDKDFLPGRKAGLFFVLGADTATIRIAEGYATAATVHEVTGDATFVAFDAGNLESVAKTVRRHYPDSRIVIMADNDRRTPGNPGLSKARAAALAVGGFVSVPTFPDGVPGSDWNDYAAWRREVDHAR
jgi:putative DNA primase/helicase